MNKKYSIVSLLIIFMLFPLSSLFAEEVIVKDVTAVNSPGIGADGYATLDVTVSWSAVDHDCSTPLYYVSIGAKIKAPGPLCAGSGSSHHVALTTTDTSAILSLRPDTISYTITVHADYGVWEVDHCNGATTPQSAAATYQANCNFVDLPRLSPDKNDCTEQTGTVGDPVFVANGEMTHQYEDFFLPGRGIDISFKRNYSNRRQVSPDSFISSPGIDKSQGTYKFLQRVTSVQNNFFEKTYFLQQSPYLPRRSGRARSFYLLFYRR